MKNISHLMLTAAAAACLAGSLPAQSIPDIAYDSAPNFLKLPEGVNFGEVAGAAYNSKGHIFVFTRTGDAYATIGTSRTFTHGGGKIFEFDQTGRYVKEIGQGLYGILFPNSIHIDPQDNIWVVDRGASLVIKFDPLGHVIWPMGRKPESINVVVPNAGRGAGPGGAPGGAAGGRGGAAGGPAGGRGGRGAPGAGAAGDLFNQPSDVAWNAAGEIYVSDGYANNRVGKYDKMGHFIKSWGQTGSEHGQFNKATSIAVDAAGNVYVTDTGNKRIQVFDGDGNYKSEITGVGAPMAACITPGPHQYLYVSNSNPINSVDNGEIYKMELDGKILGKFGEAGKEMKQFWTVNQIDCRHPNELLVSEIGNWRVQKITLKP
ncbi:MAG TPA: 6-bladed beta-propeller [Bryobacteraceae bacterium]|jgi:sugar lactone lactonase YvrE|nr:6-bladed beta-propeller [Bryobacteraceae bacterium]